mmetsp:Transcript_518/g.1582  ORF Transcript_518/g.1582 Transcript_518/m.1582 type:complete len:226 (+) Transcript_518:67-744(+)
MSNSELACTYAALILADDGVAVTADKIETITKAAGVNVEAYWPALFAKLLETKSVEELISNVGAGELPLSTPPLAGEAQSLVGRGRAPRAARWRRTVVGYFGARLRRACARSGALVQGRAREGRCSRRLRRLSDRCRRGAAVSSCGGRAVQRIAPCRVVHSACGESARGVRRCCRRDGSSDAWWGGQGPTTGEERSAAGGCKQGHAPQVVLGRLACVQRLVLVVV